jgi:hypothetical protein
MTNKKSHSFEWLSSNVALNGQISNYFLEDLRKLAF